ncbi:hypothetical protein KGQ55_01490 [Patescibacteria group bacterium]|nr:hypothetical protein [Patescibacteria group bacterium]
MIAEVVRALFLECREELVALGRAVVIRTPVVADDEAVEEFRPFARNHGVTLCKDGRDVACGRIGHALLELVERIRERRGAAQEFLRNPHNPMLKEAKLRMRVEGAEQIRTGKSEKKNKNGGNGNKDGAHGEPPSKRLRRIFMTRNESCQCLGSGRRARSTATAAVYSAYGTQDTVLEYLDRRAL